MAMVMNLPLLRTKSSGLYRHREDLGLHKVGYKEGNLDIPSPSLPSTPRRVPSGHWWSLRSSYLHCPSVRPMANRPDARGPLSPGFPQPRPLPLSNSDSPWGRGGATPLWAALPLPYGPLLPPEGSGNASLLR